MLSIARHLVWSGTIQKILSKSPGQKAGVPVILGDQPCVFHINGRFARDSRDNFASLALSSIVEFLQITNIFQ